MAKQTEFTKRAREEVCGNHNRESVLVNEACDIIEAQAEALRKIERMEAGCKKRGIGYDFEVHSIALAAQALQDKAPKEQD